MVRWEGLVRGWVGWVGCGCGVCELRRWWGQVESQEVVVAVRELGGVSGVVAVHGWVRLGLLWVWWRYVR